MLPDRVVTPSLIEQPQVPASVQPANEVLPVAGEWVAPMKRRRFLTLASAAVSAGGLGGVVPPSLQAVAWAAGSDAPEKKEVKIGFIPLTDCASVVMASVLEIDKKYGVKIIPTKEASWASVRDKLVNGEIDFAHVLYGLIYGVQMGVGGAKKDMAALRRTRASCPSAASSTTSSR